MEGIRPGNYQQINIPLNSLIFCLQNMEQEINSYSYNPHHPIAQPYTIISTLKDKLVSEPIVQPYLFEVYCPYSCKKIKIGFSKDKSSELVEFNSTTSRVVKTYLQDNIRYFVNNHQPNKKEKHSKKIAGIDWRITIDVQDKGNIAIFNPYCVDSQSPLSLYTFKTISKNKSQKEEWNFQLITQTDHQVLESSGIKVYASKSFEYIGPNLFFQEDSSTEVTLRSPVDPSKYQKFNTKQIFQILTNNLDFYLNQLQMLITLEENGPNQSQPEIKYNIDELYEKLDFNLNLLEQLRARLMNSSCKMAYQQFFVYHPRLYSGFERLKSFLNYGNTKYNVRRLAENGFFNKYDMLQNLSYFQLPNCDISNAEEQAIHNETDLRNKLFPFSRINRSLPYPNVSIQTFVESLHPEKLLSDNEKVTAYHSNSSDPYLVFTNSNGRISVWNTQLMVYKMFEIDFTKDKTTAENIRVIDSDEVKQDIKDLQAQTQFEGLFEDISDITDKVTPPVEVKPDSEMLEKIIMMGYGPSTVSKALIRVNNQSVVAALDAIQQIQNQEKLKIKNRKGEKKQWECQTCTFKNQPDRQICQMCGQMFSGIEDEDKQLQAILEAQLQAEQKKKQEQLQKLRKQKEQQQLQEKQKKQQKERIQKQQEEMMKKSDILGVRLIRSSCSDINPFLIALLMKTIDGKVMLKVFRVGLNRVNMLKFYRIEDNLIISNYTRKVYKNDKDKNYGNINEIIKEARPQIQWGCKMFEAPSDKDWMVIQSQLLNLQCQQINRIQKVNSSILLYAGEQIKKIIGFRFEDSFDSEKFTIIEGQKVKASQEEQKVTLREKKIQGRSEDLIKSDTIEINENIEEITFEVLEHFPQGFLKKKTNQSYNTNIPVTIYNENISMSEFLALEIEKYEGSLFSSKYSSTVIMSKSHGPYTSNYPTVSFVFKSIDNKPMMIESASIISKNSKIQKIYAVTGGLIFTANHISWFQVAKNKFKDMDKIQYDEWLKLKYESSDPKPAFWQPVSYFQVNNESEFEITYKRVAKYIFLLPTQYQHKGEKEEVAALKIDFFGVKGRISDEQFITQDLIEDYKRDGHSPCTISIAQFSGQSWNPSQQKNYEINSASHINTFNFCPNFTSFQIPVSLSSAFQIKFKSIGHKKQIKIGSEHKKYIRILNAIERPASHLEIKINSFKDLVVVHEKMGNFDLMETCNSLNLEELILVILSAKPPLIQYESILTKVLKLPGYQQKVSEILFSLVPKLCEPEIEVSSTGYKILMKMFEQLSVGYIQVVQECIYKAWRNSAKFTGKIRNKNYNILRNQYKIEELVLQPALFSKDYYRMINPQYTEQQIMETNASQPKTPINCKVYIQQQSKFNYIYQIDALKNANISKLEIYFPKLAPGNKYKFVLRICELIATEGDKMEEKQLYYRIFSEDFLLQVGAHSFKDTEIFKENLLNYLSIPLKAKSRYYRIYMDFMILTGYIHPRFKEFVEPYIPIPTIISEADSSSQPQKSQNESKQFIELIKQYPQVTNHYSSDSKLPPYSFLFANRKFSFVVHEFKHKFFQGENKNQFTETIEKITQNIMDKGIVSAEIKTIKLNDYSLNYKGLDFVYTFMIGLMKIYRKLNIEKPANIEDLFLLFDNFVIYEHGPIMNSTVITLIDMYTRLTPANISLFIEKIISRYLQNCSKIKTNKISQKYSVEKITTFLSKFNLPNGKLFEILVSSNNVFLVSVILKLIITNLKLFGLGNLNIFKNESLVKNLQINEVYECVFGKCLWVIDNVKNLTAEILTIGLDLFLMLLPRLESADIKSNEQIGNAQQLSIFLKKLEEKNFWKLVFLTLKMKNDALNQRIHMIFKVLIANMNEKFQKSINKMLLEIIKKDELSLYHQINPSITDDARMNHLQTILEYLSLTKSTLFLDTQTAVCLLELPLTPTLWSLAFKIIPREDRILEEIIKNFNPVFYNSLSKQIMQFCSPLSGIRPIQSNYINWLQLVKQLKLQKKNLFDIFIQNLQKTNYGGSIGLNMALISDVKQLEVTNEFAKLINEYPLEQKYFVEQNIKILISWYYLNFTTSNGSSPATELIKQLSTNISKIFQNVIELPQILKKMIKIALSSRRESQIVEKLLQQKKISTNIALNLNKRFSKCFENLLGIFNITDQLHQYFAFEADGLHYILEKMGLQEKQYQLSSLSENQNQNEKQVMLDAPIEEQLLVSEGLFNNVEASSNKENNQSASIELKEEQFANNVQLVPNNPHSVSLTVNDWTTHKKGNKSKVIYLPMVDETYNQFPLSIQFNRVAEVRSIIIGFPAASYQFSDKLIASPSGVRLQGSVDMKCFEPIGQMQKIYDDGYNASGVIVFTLNLQKIRKGCGVNIKKSIQNFGCYRVKYLRIYVQRPVVSFVEGQYSPFCGKKYQILGTNISFLSVTGDDVNKLPFRILNSCKDISKQSALSLLSSTISESNQNTAHKISNCQQFVQKIKSNFNTVKEQMKTYHEIMPQILEIMGSNNQEFGDWIIDKFLGEGEGDIQAKIINKVIVSTPSRIYERLNIFLRHIFDKIGKITSQSEIESGVLYTQSVSFMESFCKTLEQSYKIDIEGVKSNIQCTLNNIEDILTIYDKKYSSPEIKTIIKLLINVLFVKQPLIASESLVADTLNRIWANCTDSKPHFYSLLAALLVNKRSTNWISKDDHKLTKNLIEWIKEAASTNSHKILQPQIYLLSMISATSSKQYLTSQDVSLVLYNTIKHLNFENFNLFENFIKIIQNTVLGNSSKQEQLAKQLISDVSLIAKRKDPILQKFYTNILGLQLQNYVCLQNFDIEEPKKQLQIPSKILTNKNSQKSLATKLPKSIKFIQNAEFDFSKVGGGLFDKPKYNLYSEFLNAINASQFLLIVKAKSTNNKYAYVGCYNPGKAYRSEQESYCWEDVLNYEKGSFLLFFCDGESKFIENTEIGHQMLSLFGGEEQVDESLSVYDNKGAEVIKVACHLTSDSFVKFNNETYKIESIQVFNGSIKSVSNNGSSKLNAISKKAGNPYNFYRYSNVYVLPSKMTANKLLEILGVEGACQYNNKIIQGDICFEELSRQSEDQILDLQIKTNNISQLKEDLGVIPDMKIFKKFSEARGIEEVLEVGLKSVKDWNKDDKKKNFEHYFEELKNFGNIPHFFELYIKNHSSVTFLLQVVSGLPDDPNTTRNWQEEEVVQSKFMYKIVSDVFKFNRSPQLRDMDTYTGFCQITLEKLAEISKQTVRKFQDAESEDEKEDDPPRQIEKKKSEPPQKPKKKKGTGYGADGNSKWSANQWIQYRKNMSQQIQRIACIFASFLQCQRPLTDPRISHVIKNSCLLPLLENALRSGSLLDISKEAELFKNYLTIIRNLANNPATIQCILELDKKFKPKQTESIHNLLIKLHGIAQIFLQCMKSGKQSENDIPAQIAYQINRTYAFVDKAVKNISKKQHKLSIGQLKKLPLSKAYRLLLENLRFGYVDMKDKNSYKHFYAGTISAGSPSTNKILRLSQQLADLSSSLPCEATNSIFVRCDKTRIDVIKILIMGSRDTPYSNGAFCFDLYCDDNYPNLPPKMSITTTGNGKIRFNPNLYSCGKVCLSLLGTWRGQASQNWDAKLSTLLQLFISTQGITMSEDVYFNEPGLQGQQGSVEGEKKNQGYSNIVKIGNVRYAMNQQIKNPTKGFQDVIRRHFYIKKDQILAEVQKWIANADKKQAAYTGLVNDHNMNWSSELKASKGKYKQLLVKEYEELKKLLDELPEPDLQEKQQEFTFETQKAKKKAKAKQVKLGEIDVSYDPIGQKQMVYGEQVMQDRWSRYIGAMGLQAVKKQSQSCVLLIGLKPLGLQIAKNLVLSGLKELTIVETDTLKMGSEQHFYMSDLKNKKIEECIFKIKELNPYMIIRHSQTIPEVSKFHIVISTNSFTQSLPIAQQCRKNKVKFVHTQTAGVSGTFFADLGDDFSIHDTNGQQAFEGLIKDITCEEIGVVKLLDGIKHSYEDGDCIVFDKVQGMQIIEEVIQEKSEAQIFYDQLSKQPATNNINGKVFKVKVIDYNSFEIGDTRNFKPYIRNGISKGIKLPKKVHFKPFKQALSSFQENLDPNMSIYDFEKMGDNYSVFICFQAYSLFVEKNKRKPQNWNKKDVEQFMILLKDLVKKTKKSEEQIEGIINFGCKFACIAEAQLPTIGAYLGGLVAQEVIKALTNKYTPIKQFFTFHINELMQKVPEQVQKYEQLHIKEDQIFAGLKIVVGKDNYAKIEKMKTFIIGAGAIGCELLKNFAMINMGAQGKITVTDPDHIETSNLTRQFLFRQKHVKKPKSATAAATLMQMNPLLKEHISARLDKVCQQTEDIYSDQFFESQNIVANALDNVRARVYVDKRCVSNKKALFESGTLGPKGHVQVIIPHKTENYGNQNDPTQENQIPHCTLKMFPEETVHCIEWSRDIFGKVFTLNPKALKKVLETKDPNAVEGQQRETVSKMIEYKPMNFDDCVGQAVRKFYKYFRNNVKQLLHTYPLDLKTKDGKLFWQLPKRPPKQIPQIDFTDEIHQTFIASYSVVLAKIYNLPYPKNFRKQQGKQEIMQIAKNIKVQDFVPSEQQSAKLQKMNQAENKQEKMMEEEEPPKQTIPDVEIKLTEEIMESKVMPEQFEKDQDSNGHIDLIYSMSNLRCRNYGLNQCKWIEAKLKAGKIMAALSTTTSVVAALQTIEIMKYMIETTQWRNVFANLAVPLIQISEPGQPPKHKIGKTQFTVWDLWQFKCSTLKDLLTQIEQKYGVEGYNISTADGTPVFWQKMYVGKQQAMQNLLNKPLKQMFNNETVIELNILMRQLEETQGEKKVYENVPRIRIQIV